MFLIFSVSTLGLHFVYAAGQVVIETGFIDGRLGRVVLLDGLPGRFSSGGILHGMVHAPRVDYFLGQGVVNIPRVA